MPKIINYIPYAEQTIINKNVLNDFNLKKRNKTKQTDELKATTKRRKINRANMYRDKFKRM